MIQVDLSYNGITRAPSDFACKDGDLAECINLIPENGELEPVCTPPVLLNCDAELLFIHKGNSYRNYIVNQGGLLKAFKETEEGIEYYPFSTNIASLGGILNTSALGNTLILSCEEGLYYLLFKDSDYKLLGQKPPFIPLSFGLKGSVVESEKFTIDIKDQKGLVFTEENVNKVTDEVIPRANKLINENLSSVGMFFYPFFIRYALRLYDNSLVMHSAPILMIPSTSMAPVALVYEVVCDGSVETSTIRELKTQIRAHACVIDYQYTGNELSKQELSKWSDIIKSIDVFVSNPIVTYNQNGKCTQMHWPEYTYWGLLNFDHEENNFKPVYNKNYVTKFLDGNVVISMPKVSQEQVRNQIETCGSFYKVGSVNLYKENPRIRLPVKRETLSTLNFQERMSDDYNSHDLIRPKYSYIYNSRLNITNLCQVPFTGFPAESIGCYANERGTFIDGEKEYTIEIYTFIREDEKEIVVKSTSNIPIAQFPQYIYYPSTNAYKMVIKKTRESEIAYAEIQLSKHKNLNGAFFFNFFESLTWTDTYDTSRLIPTINPEIYFPNKIYTSEVNNPFIFPVSGINTLGVGKILGIASATKALSQGQFGQFPLYAFTNEGIWALEVSNTGTYSSKQVVTRDVCNNPASITQIDGAVIFTTDRGIMILQGSETQCISDSMNGKHFRADTLESIHAHTPDIANVIASISDNLSFPDYIRDCSIAYDYPNARLIFNNPNTRYQYIYSLRSGTFSKIHHGKIFPRVINSYPDCYLQDTDGNVYNYSSIQDENDITARTQGIIITRPLSFGSTSLKTIVRILNRGIYKQPSYVKIGLYGSRDGVTYYKLRSLHGMGWKYFRIVLYTSLLPSERLSCTSFMLEERFTNKLR